jgi:hypothetical protein
MSLYLQATKCSQKGGKLRVTRVDQFDLSVPATHRERVRMGARPRPQEEMYECLAHTTTTVPRSASLARLPLAGAPRVQPPLSGCAITCTSNSFTEAASFHDLSVQRASTWRFELRPIVVGFGIFVSVGPWCLISANEAPR